MRGLVRLVFSLFVLSLVLPGIVGTLYATHATHISVHVKNGKLVINGIKPIVVHVYVYKPGGILVFNTTTTSNTVKLPPTSSALPYLIVVQIVQTKDYKIYSYRLFYKYEPVNPLTLVKE